MRTYLQIMREVLIARKAGVSTQVALLATVHSDEDWDTLWHALMRTAVLDKSLNKFRPRK